MHVPVLLDEAIRLLDPQPGENFIDATIGGGGHAEKLISRIGTEGKLLGIDWDEEQIRRLKEEWREKTNVILTAANYKNLENIIKQYYFAPPDGILFDLGFGLHTLVVSGKGFSFQKDEPLIMRYGGDEGPTAREILNTASEAELERIFREYGDERYSENIAHAVAVERKRKQIERTADLVRIIGEAIPRFLGRRGINPATRTFQALRIAVNDEFGNIKKGVSAAIRVLAKNGRIVVITFHSGEDRVAKEIFKKASEEKTLEILTKHVIRPGRAEVLRNRASRSAKLRAGIKK